MADDLIQRPYRSSDTIARAPSKPAGSSGSDPLAELARLIGQNDPFAEYGRTPQAATHQPPAPPVAPPLPKFEFTPSVAPPPDSHVFAQPNFARAQLGASPQGGNDDLYHVQNDGQGYPPEQHEGAYAQDGYQQDPAQQAREQQHYDDYEDVAPKRRRMSIMLVAGAVGLALVGSAGAFGYRALFGKSGSSAPPPVIKADTTPTKIMSASARDSGATKVSDRVGGESERLVSREETPVDIKDKAVAAAFPPPVDQAQASMPAQGSGVVTPDPKRVRTITIHPDGAVVADATPNSATPQALPPTRVTTVAPAARNAAPQPPVQQAAPPPQQPQRVAVAPPAEAEAQAPAPARKPPTLRAQAAQAAAPSNAPLSLNPDAPPVRPAARAQAPMRTASVPPAEAAPAAPSSAGGYAVQVSSQRSEAEAQAAFRSLQSKYPGQLGGKQAVVHKVDLGAKGIYYRAMVPAGSGSEATELCSSLKAAGGSCLIQRN